VESFRSMTVSQSEHRRAPVVEVERLEEGREGRVSALLALREIAAVDDANLDHDPEKHGDHSDDARQDPADEVQNQQVRRVPSPEDRVGQLSAVAEDEAVAEVHDELCENYAEDSLEDELDGQVVAEGQGGNVHEPGREHAKHYEQDVSENVVLGIGGGHDLHSTVGVRIQRLDWKIRAVTKGRRTLTMPPRAGVEL
jgi:hypothetical protein